MSQVLLLLDDGEMQQLGTNTGGRIVLAGNQGDPGGQFSDAVITSVDGGQLTLGNHFLTTTDGAGGEQVIKLENVSGLGPVEVLLDKKPPMASPTKQKGKGFGKTSSSSSSQLNSSTGSGTGPPENDEKKVCLWPMGNGTTCGKTFTKFDSLKRHLQEAHKGVRPFSCTMCDKTYGRRDYLQRHLKSHNANFTANLSSAGGGNMSAGPIAKAIKMGSGGQNQQIQVVQVPQGIGGGVQILQQSPPEASEVTSIPFISNLGSLPGTTPHKPSGSKICRWVQNDGTVCGKAFSKLDSLRRHVNELHKSIRPYACSLCEKSYGRRDYLDRHMRTHNKKKNLNSLDQWGPNSGVLMQGDEAPPPPKIPKKKRKDIPPEEKKICLWVMDDGTACGKTFTKFDSLKRHVSEAHKGQRPYSCTLCGKTYGRRDYLLRHLKSHNDAEVANLNIPKVSQTAAMSGGGVAVGGGGGGGGSASINFSSLTPHPLSDIGIVGGGGPTPAQQASQANIKMAHSAKKRAAEDKKTCKWVLDNGSVCGRTFSKFDSLRRHVAELHKGIRPFVCELCDKNYGRKDYLDRHLRDHAAEDAKKEAAEAALERLENAPMVPEEMVGHLMDDDDEEEMEDEDEDMDEGSEVVDEGSEVVLPDGGVVTVVGSGQDDV